MEKRIRRIAEMEGRLNRVAEWLAHPSEASVAEDVHLLETYYHSRLWRSDFEADEAGKLPLDLPRGVLSEDAVYNALEAYAEQEKKKDPLQTE